VYGVAGGDSNLISRTHDHCSQRGTTRDEDAVPTYGFFRKMWTGSPAATSAASISSSEKVG